MIGATRAHRTVSRGGARPHLWTFDLLAFNSRDLWQQPLVKRQACLQALLERFGCSAISLSEPVEDGVALLGVASNAA